jgi:hypothetical protein
MDKPPPSTPAAMPAWDLWLKLPGLFYRSELEQVIEIDSEREYLFELVGHDAKGRELVAVFYRMRRNCKERRITKSI